MPTNPTGKPATTVAAPWGSSFRLVASDRWKAKSAMMGRAVTEALVEYSRPLPSMNVIDLASGTGEPAITLAERVGPNGSVTAVDQSAELLQIAEERAKSKKLENVSIQQADAHSLPFANKTFDLATCRFGVMFFSNAIKALTELRRVLKPGSRACFAAWGPVEQPYWQCTMKIVQRHAGGPMLPPGGADPFRFSANGSLSEVLRGAGFADVEESTTQSALAMAGRSRRSNRICLRGRGSLQADVGTRFGRNVACDPLGGRGIDGTVPFRG